MYTLEALQVDNRHKELELQERDVAIANEKVRLIEKNLESPHPSPGDIIICRGYNNYHQKQVVYERGLINEVEEDGNLHVCVRPQEPFVCKNGALSTSGGYWFSCHSSEIKRVEEIAARVFWCWDCGGSRGGGGVYFRARVKVWEVESKEVY